MADDYPTPAHQWFDRVWNQQREETIEEMMSPDAVVYGLEGDTAAPMYGPSAFTPFYHSIIGAIPDIHVEVLESIRDGDLLAVRCEVTGTHTGNTLGVLATGKTVCFGGMSMMRIRDGQFVEAWNHFDFGKLYRQLAPDPDVD